MALLYLTCFGFCLLCFHNCVCWVLSEVNLNDISAKTNGYPGTIQDINENEIREKFVLIYPGTKWCGPGNIAEGDDDLGELKKTDACCRDHDNCPDVIAAGETRYNLTNVSFYSRLSCECDNNFRQCLRVTKTQTAKQIGFIYFNALGTQCYRQDYAIIGCNKRGGWLNQKCLEYSFDINSTKRFQWFDVPLY